MIDNNNTQPDPDGDEDEDLIARFGEWDKLIDAHWSEWRKEAEEDFAFVAGKQWDDDVIAKMEEDGRVPVTFNHVQPTIDAVAGAEIMGRQQVSYEPRQVGATAQNEVLSKGAEWVRDECDAEHEESEAARDLFICGMGWTETRMDYEEHEDGQIVIERVDPLEVSPDPSSRKANCIDARYIRWRKPMSKDAARELAESFGEPELGPDGPGDSSIADPVVVDPAHRYEDGSDQLGDDETYVTRWQWYEKVTVHRLADPHTGEQVQLEDPEEDIHAKVQATNADRAKLGQLPIQHVTQPKRRYRQAFVAGGRVFGVTDLDCGEFTLKAMTGKRDRNRGVWYGLARPMKDPQRFENKFISQLLHILNTNAKGGLLAEVDAFVDQRKAEADWADPGAIVFLNSGALGQHPKVKTRDAPEYPTAIDKLLQISSTAVRDTTGVNLEMLGMAERDQPGILEHQRKQAAYGILSAFFDSIRRYRKVQGRLLLRFMQKYLPEDFLVRIINDQGSPEYKAIGSALKDDTIRFSVIVDDAPAGPNEKQQTFQVLQAILPLLQSANLPPDVWADLVRYSPLPAAVSEKLAQALIGIGQQAQAQAQSPEAQAMKQLQMAGAQADVQEKQASAAHKMGQANLLDVQARQEAHGHAMTLTGQPTPADRLDNAKAAKAEAEAIQTITQQNQPVGPELY